MLGHLQYVDMSIVGCCGICNIGLWDCLDVWSIACIIISQSLQLLNVEFPQYSNIQIPVICDVQICGDCDVHCIEQFACWSIGIWVNVDVGNS